MPAQPTGTVTFVFTDVEGSTSRWAAHEDSMAEAIASHDEIVRSHVDRHSGYVFSRGGDSFAIAFATAVDAVAMALAVQSDLASHSWPAPAGPIRIRIGLHTGEANERDGDYFGPAVNQAARIADAGHGGQILMSRTTVDVATGLDELRSLGFHSLKGLPDAVEIFQLGAGEFASLRADRGFSIQLPSYRDRFVGRRDLLDRMLGDLRTHGRLVTLTGSGGSGKTRLAVEAAGRAASAFDRVHFVDLAVVAEDDRVAPAFAEAMEYTPPSSAPVTSAVAEHIGMRPTLLIVDNCEHVIDSVAEVVDELLGACPELVVIATSREALDIDGERVQRVPSLDTSAGESVELFLDRARAAGAEIGEDDVTTESIAAICTRLDGLPLAIELAAARTRVLPIEDVLAGLDDRFRILTSGRRRTRGRQQTLEATIAWSFDLLSSDESAMIEALSVFPGDITVDGAAAVAGVDRLAALDEIDSLVTKSLLQPTNDRSMKEARFRMLETVRVYAHDRLRESEDRAHSALRAYVDHVAAISDAVDDPYSVAQLEPLAQDLDAALVAAIDMNMGAQAGRIAAVSFPHWATRGLLDRGAQLLERVTPLTEGGHRARVLGALAHVQTLRPGEFVAGIVAAYEALENAPAADPLVRGHAHLRISDFLGFVDGALDEQRRHREQARTLLAAADHPTSTYLRFLDARSQLISADYDAAADSYRSCLGRGSLIGPLALSGLTLALIMGGRDVELRELAEGETWKSQRSHYRRRALQGEAQAGCVEIAAAAMAAVLDDADTARHQLHRLRVENGSRSHPVPSEGEIAAGLAVVAWLVGDRREAGRLVADTFVALPCPALTGVAYRIHGELEGWSSSRHAELQPREITRRSEAYDTLENPAALDAVVTEAVDTELRRLGLSDSPA